jgi:hypothetical protein
MGIFLFVFFNTSEIEKPKLSLFSSYWWNSVAKHSVLGITSPIRWKKKEWISCGLIVGVTGIVMNYDEQIKKEIQKNKSPGLNKLSLTINPLGSWQGIVGITGGYFLGEIFNNNKIKRASIISIESVIISEIFVLLGKMVIGRARPYKGEGNKSFSPFTLQSENHSFPSGHTTVIFAIVTGITEECKNKYLSIALYSLASIVGVARIYEDKHWASDVVIGASLGIAVGKYVSKIRKKEKL